MNVISLRQAGGVYFAPAGERDSLFRLRQLIADIPQVVGLDPFVCALGVPDDLDIAVLTECEASMRGGGSI